MMSQDTIVAPATPYGFGGIAVVRISGPLSKQIIQSISFTPKGTQPPLPPRYSALVYIKDKQGNPFEESLVTFFKSPNSYTGEDSVEISCHGNPALVQKIVSRCCDEGARIAEPGEFTRRSFINGKLDLIQAESVAALIHSQSNESAALNFKLLKGELSQNLQTIKKSLIDTLTYLEFELDFSEENLQPNVREKLLSIAIPLSKQIINLISSYKDGHLLTEGALVVIVGESNSGKSTLLNSLSGFDRAITSETPGTTRDSIDVSMFMHGVPIKLVDTAGIRDASGEIEQKGIKRTHVLIDDADLILRLNTPDKNHLTSNSYIENKPVLSLINKIDLLTTEDLTVLNEKYPDWLLISAKTGKGLNTLKSKIKAALGISKSLSDNIAITTSRQYNALSKALDYAQRGIALLTEEDIAYELAAVEFRSALDEIDILLGKTTPDDIINNIFSSFCVGK